MWNRNFLLPLALIISSITSAQLSKVNLPLSSTKVEDALLGEDGLLWVGTTEGLNLFYDDENHVFYSKIQDSLSLLNSEIKKLAFNSSENLIAFTQGGLNVYNAQGFSFHRIRLASTPTGIWESNEGEMWVTTAQSGIYVLNADFSVRDHYLFDPINPLSISTSRFDSYNSAQFYFEPSKQKTLIATANGLNVYDNTLKTFKRYFKGQKTQFSTNTVLAVMPLNGTKIGVVTENELVVLDLENNSFNVIKSWKDPVQNVNSIDEKQLLLTHTNKTSILSTTDNNSFKQNNFRTKAAIDHVVSADDRYYFWKKGAKTLQEVNKDFEVQNSFVLDDPINAVSYTPKSNTLFVATNSGLSTLSNDQRRVADMNGFKGSVYFVNNETYYINVTANTITMGQISGNKNTSSFQKKYTENFNDAHFEYVHPYVLIGKEDLKIFDAKNKQLYTSVLSKEQLKEVGIDKIKAIDKDIYFSTENGVIKAVFEDLLSNRKNNSVTTHLTYYEYNELLNREVPRGFTDIEKVGNSIFISDPQQGLLLYDGDLSKYVQNFNYNGDDTTTLASSTPTKLFFDEKNKRLYIGTIGSGLFSFDIDSKSFSKLDVEDGLLSNNIFDFAWAGEVLLLQTGQGINFIDNGIIKNINHEDGLNLNSFHLESIHIIEDQLLFTGNDKFQSLPMADLKAVQKNFDVGILNVMALDKNNSRKLLTIEEGQQINFDYTSKIIEFELYPSTAYKNDQINYYLQWNDEAPQKNGTNNKIQLSGIPYYAANVTIYAVDGNGQQSANTLSFTINNAPPWWLRYETIALYVVLTIVLVYSLIKFREQQTKKKMEGERKSKELEEARQLQMSLLPKTNPEIDGLEISTYLKSATEIGGDYYDFFYKKDDYFYAICGDATGHGVISGIMVSVTKAGLNGVPMGAPSTILEQLNRIVKRVNFGRLRMSLSVVKFGKSSIEMSSAAMPPSYYFNAKQNQLEEILVPNLPLGGIESEKFDGVKKDFNKGDILVMISDGLPELPNPQNQMLDYEKVHQCVKSNAEKDAESIKNALVDLSDEWAQGVMNPDDITIVVIKKAA